MKVSVLTPTADRPVAFAFCETMMARQTVQPLEWIVADGGEVPVRCTMGQRHIHDPRPPGASNFANNLLNGIDAAEGDLLVIVEDDDAYFAEHLEHMVAVAERGYRIIGTEDIQRYYNVAARCWRIFDNVGASLCQTAIRRELFPLFRSVIQQCYGNGVDSNLWRSAGRNAWGFSYVMTVVGIKGLPGRVGLGVGHRPDARWHPDPELVKLGEWIGKDVERYRDFGSAGAAAAGVDPAAPREGKH